MKFQILCTVSGWVNNKYMKNSLKVYIPFLKTDKTKKMVYGYITSESEDSQGEVVCKEAIVDAWEDYMKFANIREMHQPSAVGVTKEFMHDDKGTWIGAKIVDKDAWEKVLEGVYKGFSIGGKVLEKVDNIIKNLKLSEISIVDRPANPDAIFTMVKRNDDGELSDINKIIPSDNLKVDSFVIKEFNFHKDNFMKKLKKDNEEKIEPEKIAPQSGETENKDEKPTVEEKELEEKSREQATDEQKVLDENKEKEDGENKESSENSEEIEGTETEQKDDGDDKGENKEIDEKIENKEKVEEKEEEEKGEDVKDLKKDTAEVSSLSNVASELNYLIKAFRQNKRSEETCSQMQNALDCVMSAIQMEAKSEMGSQKLEGISEISKVIKDEFGGLAKMVEGVTSKVDDLTKEVGQLKEKVDIIENQPKADRPKKSFTVDRSGLGTEDTQKGYDELLSEKKEIEEEINKVYEEAKVYISSPNSIRELEVKKKMDDLQVRMSQINLALRKFTFGA